MLKKLLLAVLLLALAAAGVVVYLARRATDLPAWYTPETSAAAEPAAGHVPPPLPPGAVPPAAAESEKERAAIRRLTRLAPWIRGRDFHLAVDGRPRAAGGELALDDVTLRFRGVLKVAPRSRRCRPTVLRPSPMVRSSIAIARSKLERASCRRPRARHTMA